MKIKLIVFFCIIAFITMAGIFIYQNTRAVKKGLPLNISFWHWGSELDIDQYTVKKLNSLKMVPLFIKVGTFDVDNQGRIVIIRDFQPRNISLLTQIPIHIVYPFSPDFISNFKRLDNEHIANSLLKNVQNDLNALKMRGIVVKGVQFDFDCPTSRLEKYSSILRIIRQQLDTKYKLSITSLITWLKKREFKKLISNVDFYVPMIFGYKLPETRQEKAPIIEINILKKAIKQCARLGVPFYVGLPIYGYCLVYDESGNLHSMHTSFDLDTVTESPYVTLNKAYKMGIREEVAAGEKDYNGTNRYIFTINKPLFLQGSIFYPDWQLVFEVISQEGLKKYLALVKECRDNMKGVLLFRYPSTKDNLILGVEEITDIQSSPQVAIKSIAKDNNLFIFEVEVKNSTQTPTMVSKKDNFIQVNIGKGRFKDIQAGNFDGIEAFYQSKTQLIKTTLSRANVIRLYEYYLDRGEVLQGGPITVLGSEKPEVTWHFITPGNFDQKEVYGKWLD